MDPGNWHLDSTKRLTHEPHETTKLQAPQPANNYTQHPAHLLWLAHHAPLKTAPESSFREICISAVAADLIGGFNSAGLRVEVKP